MAVTALQSPEGERGVKREAGQSVDAKRLAELADRLGIACTADELAQIGDAIPDLLNDIDATFAHWSDAVTQTGPPAARSHAAPLPEEDPYNAWATICHIEGASTGPLAGKTVGVKDNIQVAGLPMQNGSVELEGYIAEADAEVVCRVLDAGGTIVGKARCENYCLSGGSHTGYGGPVRNPHDPERTTGGSSSGCAALVASGAVDLAIGGDQGGSVRIPASFCGVVGLKPTWGRIPYAGAMAMEPFIDHLGPITRNVADNRLFFSVLSGDKAMREAPLAGIEGLRLGVLEEGFGQPNADAAVERSVRECLAALGRTGISVAPVSVPQHRHAPPIWTAIGLDGMRRILLDGEGAGDSATGGWPLGVTRHLHAQRAEHGVRASLRTLQFFLAAQLVHEERGGAPYAFSRQAAERLRSCYDDVLNSVDVLAMPTTPHAAARLPGDTSLEASNFAASSMAANTVAFNLTHHPALSVPCGSVAGLPVGLMLVGRHGEEETLYRVAAAVEAS